MGMFVLLTANEPKGCYVNGDLGTISAWGPDYICVNLLRGPCVMVARNTWLNYEYSIGITPSGEPCLNARIIGSFTQFPIIPAYAMTITRLRGKRWTAFILICQSGPVLLRDSCTRHCPGCGSWRICL